MNWVDLGWFYLLWRKITNSAFIWVDFVLINNNIKFSLKLMQIEITSTLPLVRWMWISIFTPFNYNLIFFIHPQKAELIVIVTFPIKVLHMFERWSARPVLGKCPLHYIQHYIYHILLTLSPYKLWFIYKLVALLYIDFPWRYNY